MKNQKPDFNGKPVYKPDFNGKPAYRPDFNGKPIPGEYQSNPYRVQEELVFRFQFLVKPIRGARSGETKYFWFLGCPGGGSGAELDVDKLL